MDTSKPIDVFPDKYWFNVCLTLFEEWTSFPHNIVSWDFLAGILFRGRSFGGILEKREWLRAASLI